MELLEKNGIYKHTIKFLERKQPFYGLIYTFNLVGFENLKAYIETHEKTGFIQPFNSLQMPLSFLLRSLTIAFAIIRLLRSK